MYSVELAQELETIVLCMLEHGTEVEEIWDLVSDTYRKYYRDVED